VFLALTFVLLLASGHTLWARLYSGSTVIVSEFAAIRARLYSGSTVIVSEFAAITPLLVASIVLDSVQGVLSGVATGCGWQHLAAVTNLVAFYLVGMRLALILAFKLDLGTRGLWAGLICGLMCQACSLFVITTRTRWSELAE
jgi:MATE family multidrug resistance protein